MVLECELILFLRRHFVTVGSHPSLGLHPSRDEEGAGADVAHAGRQHRHHLRQRRRRLEAEGNGRGVVAAGAKHGFFHLLLTSQGHNGSVSEAS